MSEFSFKRIKTEFLNGIMMFNLNYKSRILLNSILLLLFLLNIKVQSADGHIPLKILLSENAPVLGTKIKPYNQNNILTHIPGDVKPHLFVNNPDKASGTSIIICPRSGYSELNDENTPFIAEWQNHLMITASVLVYILPRKNIASIKSIAGLRTVRQTFRNFWGNALQWGFSRDKIGLWGSLMGGAAMAATHYSRPFLMDTDTSGLYPDFLMLAWPVTSFFPELGHKGSMKHLQGNVPSKEQITFYSSNKWGNKNTLPTFLVHVEDDNFVPVSKRICFFEALNKSNVPVELYIYESGGGMV